MDVTIHELNIKYQAEAMPQSFVINESAQNWEIWHKQFGHISYSMLKEMLDNNLVRDLM